MVRDRYGGMVVGAAGQVNGKSMVSEKTREMGHSAKKQVPPLRRRFAPASVGMTELSGGLRVGAVRTGVELESG